MSKFGKNNPNYKDGRWLVKHYCKDCGIEVGVYSKQCLFCFRKNPPFAVDKKRCIDCGTILKNQQKAIRCRKCRDKNYIGRKHWNWQGGKVEQKERIRKSLEYKNWRRSIFVRDEFTCQECGAKSVYLEAHHLKPFAKFPELRFKPENGITLCRNCHNKTRVGWKI